MLGVDLDGSRQIWPADVGCLVDSGWIQKGPSDRPDDQAVQVHPRSWGQRRSASRTLAGKGDPRRLPRQASPPGDRLVRGALAGSGPGTSPCRDGLSLVTSMVVPQHPVSSNTPTMMAGLDCADHEAGHSCRLSWSVSAARKGNRAPYLQGVVEGGTRILHLRGPARGRLVRNPRLTRCPGLCWPRRDGMRPCSRRSCRPAGRHERCRHVDGPPATCPGTPGGC